MANMNEQQRKENLAKLMKESKGLLAFGDDDEFAFSRIPFELPELDKLLGGGIPRKKLTLVIGPTNVGKTYLALRLASNVQKGGGTVAWIDTEFSWDREWVAKCGLDASTVLVAQPTTGEDAFNIARELMKNSVDLLVLDSIAGLVPTALQEQDFGYNPIASQARMVNQALPKLFSNLRYGTALLFINQVRSSLGPVSLPNMPGGLAQEFFAHFLLEVRRAGWIEEQKQKIGFDIEVRVRKSKVGGQPYQSCTVPFKMEGGIDIAETLFREALALEIIKHSGAWFKWGDEKFHGMTGIREFFVSKPDKLVILQGEVDAKQQ